MPAGETCLKFLAILKKREAGDFDHYYNRKGNYDSPSEFLGPVYGWKSWQDVHDGRAGQLPGYVAVQMRPRPELMQREDGALYVQADYGAPFDQWKFALRHQPHELPGWTHVAEVKAECLRLLPAWADAHIIRGGTRSVTAGMAVAALAGSRIEQHGGSLWAYGDAAVFQRGPGPHDTHLHDRSVGHVISGVQDALAFDHSTAHVYHLGRVRAYGSATIILHPGGQHGTTGKIAAYGSGVRVFIVQRGRQVPFVNFRPLPEPHPFTQRPDINQPFNCEVD